MANGKQLQMCCTCYTAAQPIWYKHRSACLVLGALQSLGVLPKSRQGGRSDTEALVVLDHKMSRLDVSKKPDTILARHSCSSQIQQAPESKAKTCNVNVSIIQVTALVGANTGRIRCEADCYGLTC